MLGERGLVIGRRLGLEDDQGGLREVRERRRQAHLLDTRSRGRQPRDHALEVLEQLGLGAIEQLARDGEPRRLEGLRRQ